MSEEIVNFIQLKNRETIQRAIEFSHICPICDVASIFEFFGTGIGYDIKEINYLVRCPNCKNFFLARFELDGNYKHTLTALYPSHNYKHRFPAEIKHISSDFIRIYEQSITAKNLQLDELVGAGLRKSLEFLTIDYIKNVLKETPLKNLEKRIEQLNIKNIQVHATLVRWVGNDNVHTEIKHPEFTVEDMIKSLSVIVYYLHAEYLSKKLLKIIPVQ